MTIEMYQDVMNHLQIDKYRELIIEQDQKITELKRSCEETQELLDKQIEATYRLDKENAELKEALKGKVCKCMIYFNFKDLEKENAELKIKKIPELERKIASIRGCHRVDLVKLKARTEQVARLKKENAELKSGCGMCYRKDKEQLTKAKEIIKAFLDSSDLNIKHKAEEFLGEF